VTTSTTAAYRLTEEQVLLRETVRALAEERIAPRAAEIDRSGDFPWDIKELLAAHDVLGLGFPEAYAGVGGDLLTVCLAIEEIARACVTSSLILAVQELGSLPIRLAGSDDQRARWLPDLAAGRSLIAFALTEAGAGSDPAATRTRATRDGAEYVLDGSKRFITHGGIADLVTVFAVTDPDATRHRTLSCFVVERGTPGFSAGRLEHKMGIRGSPTAELVPHRKASQSFQPASKTRPGSAALFGAMWPAPWRKMTSGFVSGPSRTSVPVVISADLIIIGDHVGWRSFSRAAMPATCGLDIEVPL